MKKLPLLLALSCCVASAPALAGFQWTPPSGTDSPLASPAAPVAAVTASDLLTPLPDAPVIQDAQAPQKASKQPVPPKNVSAFEAPALAKVNKADVSATVLDTPAPAAAGSYERELPQKHAIRPIRIDTRGDVSAPASVAAPALPATTAPVNIVPQHPAQNPVIVRPATPMPAQTLPVQTTERKKDDSPFVPAGTATDVAAPAMTWIAPVDQKPIDVPTAPVVASPEIPAPSSDGFAAVDGFGRDIPLPLAVRQIVPQGYGLAFDRNVNTKLTVTWEGGASWMQVLNSALAAKGLRADVSGQLVRIHRNTQVIGANEITTTNETAAVSSGVTLMKAEAPQSVPMQSSSAAPAAAPVDADEMASMNQSMEVQQPAAMAAVEPRQTAAQMPTPQEDLANMMPAAGEMAAPAPAPIASPVESTLAASQTWTASRGMTLRDALTAWSQQVGVQLYWASGYDYPLATDVTLQGTFDQAVQTLLKGFSGSHPKPTGRLHPNLPNGPAVLVIETKDQPK